jgi:hypothetical protein
LPIHKSKRNWSFIKNRTGTNQSCWRADIDGRGKRSLQHDTPDTVVCRQRNRERRAERFAPESLGRVARDREGIGRPCVFDETLLGRASTRPAVTAVAQRYETAAIVNKIAKALISPAQRAAVAVKIDKDRLFVARRDVSDDHTLAVYRVEHHLFCVSEADRRRRRSPALWKILEQALCDVN